MFQRPYKVLNWIELSTKNLINNYQLFQTLNPNFKILPVLKSNAYGHGLVQIAQMLLALKPEYLVVDGYFEALEIRKVSKSQPVLIMGAIDPDNYSRLKFSNFTFVVHDKASIQALGQTNKKIKIHLEINTGMNRHGIDASQIQSFLQLIRIYPRLELEGIMSHLADTDNPESNQSNLNQQQIFDECALQTIQAGFKLKYIHLAQTAGSTKINSQYSNTIRLGLGLYGINPLELEDHQYKSLQNLQPVLSLHSTITKIIELQKGDKVSYNGTFEAKTKTRIGIIPLGYYEGLDRSLSNSGVVKWQGRFLPIVGRVCMNHTMLDLVELEVKVGDEIVVYSNNNQDPNSIQNLWRDDGLFAYTTLVHLAESVRRIII